MEAALRLYEADDEWYRRRHVAQQEDHKEIPVRPHPVMGGI